MSEPLCPSVSSSLTIEYSPHFFKSCKISAVALIKMVHYKLSLFVDTRVLIGLRCHLQVIHARSGVPWEIMGLMQGKVVGHSLVIMDSFALPVQGTETRVNAANEANEYMVQYIQESEKVRELLPAQHDVDRLTCTRARRWDG